jgi:uncharacterized phage protein (TIGR01671 family)
MLREIKFRAWNTQSKMMVDLKSITPMALDEKLEIDGLFIPFTETLKLMQYAGLKDKNGKEIYEGDIVKFNNNDIDLSQICFGEFPVYDMETEEVTDTAHGWYAKVIFTDGLSRLEPFCYDRVINTQWIGTLDIEVIGNIYENPELLEVSE